MVVARDAYVVNAYDIRMRKARRRLCFAVKPFDELYIGTIRLVKNFDGYGARKKSGFVFFEKQSRL